MEIFNYFRAALQAPPADAPIAVSPAPAEPDNGKPAEDNQAIVVVPDAPANSTAPVVVRPKAVNVACLQLPEYPEGSSSFHKVSSIEEYKILLELATRSTWATKFSEADYLVMEKWLGMDKFRPKTPNRICEAPQSNQSDPHADSTDAGQAGSAQESNQVQPATDTMPVVVVPAESRPTRVRSRNDRRPRGTYY